MAKIKGAEVILPDPNPEFSTGAVLNHYAGLYVELITAKTTGPEIKDDHTEYRFDSVMGTKG